MSSYIVTIEAIQEALKALHLRDSEECAHRLSSSPLLELVPHGSLNERVHLLKDLLRTTIEERRCSARRACGLGAPEGTSPEDLERQAREEFRQQNTELDRWSAVYFYRLCKMSGSKLAKILSTAPSFRFEESGVPKQIRRMEKEAVEELRLIFRDRLRARRLKIEEGDSKTHPSAAIIDIANAVDAIPILDYLIPRPEIDEYYCQLMRSYLAVIVGPSGVGKTVIGAEIARRLINEQYNVIWVNILKRSTLEWLFEDIGHSLARYDDTTLLRKLATIDASQEPSLNADRKFQLKLSALSRILKHGKFALILNDAHVLASDERFDVFIHELYPVDKAFLPLVLISRETFSFLPASKILGGFNRDAATTMFHRAGIELPSDVFELLYTKVDGNPKLIQITIADFERHRIPLMERVNREKAYRTIVNNLVKAPNIHEYLNLIFQSSVTNEERRFIEIFCLFRLGFDPDDTNIQAILNEEGVTNIQKVLIALIRKNIITYHPTTEEITCHDIIAEFIRRSLNFNDKQRLHNRIAIYHLDRGDIFETAYQWYKANDSERASQLLVEHADNFFTNAAFASKLCDVQWLILELRDRRFDKCLRWELIALLGRAQEHLGDYRSALTTYQQVYAQIPLFKGQIHRESLRVQVRAAELESLLGNKEQALEELNRIEREAQNYPEFLAWIYAVQSTIHQQLGQPEPALTTAQRASAQLLPESAPELRLEVYQAIGNTYFMQSDTRQARHYYELATRETERLDKPSLPATIKTLDRLIILYIFCEGDLHRARRTGEQALQLARDLGSIDLIERLLGNLGLAHHWLGEYDKALAYYQETLAINGNGNARHHAIDQGNIGVTLYKCNKTEEAHKYLLAAFKWFRDHNDTFISYVAAYLSFLSTGDDQRAYADLAWREAQRVAHPTCYIVALRAYARAYPDQAVAALERALAHAECADFKLYRAVCQYELSFIHPDRAQREFLYKEAVQVFETCRAEGWANLARTRCLCNMPPSGTS